MPIAKRKAPVPSFLRGAKTIPTAGMHWVKLDDYLKQEGNTEEVVKSAMVTEVRGKARLRIITRLMGRLSRLRRIREDQELIDWVSETGGK